VIEDFHLFCLSVLTAAPPHIEFQSYLAEEIGTRWPERQQCILAYESAIEKVWLLDMDELLSILRPYYSDIGRPSAPTPEVL
jgi:hypothetical protein